MKTFKCIFPFLFVIIFVSCNEENDVYTKVAILKWQNPAGDGCGFFVEIDKKEYKPESENIISEEFKTSDSIPVIVTFIYLDKKLTYWCGWSGQIQSDGIKIISIERL